jgi:ABC-type uncharacterized transport system substrate-binding protein
MRRREFTGVLAGAAAAPSVVWPLWVRAQQAEPRRVGWLGGTTQAVSEAALPAFRRALAAHGFVEGRNLVLDFRYADGNADRLVPIAADLLRQPLDVVVTYGAVNAGTDAIRIANPTVPIVLYGGADPVQFGLAASLNRPGGNVTGIFTAELGSKRLGLIHELLPEVPTIALLVNPANVASPTEAAEIQDAAPKLNLKITMVKASNEVELYSAFEQLAEQRARALLVTPNPFFSAAARQIAALAARFAIPALYALGTFPRAGGLMSYGADISDALRILGDYAGRILKGAKAGDLPIQRSTKFELIINLKTAKTLNLTIPNTLLAIADEVIE